MVGVRSWLWHRNCHYQPPKATHLVTFQQEVLSMKKLSVILAMVLVVGMVSVVAAGPCGMGYGKGPRGGLGGGMGRGRGYGICKVVTPEQQIKLTASGRMGPGYGPQRHGMRNW
jgi:hypothetical protein